MALTIYDISEKAGVSIATVSRVLNGSNKVKASTRQKIMDIITEYDYAPNASARGMGLQSSKTIGILCADSSDLFFSKAIYYLEQELQANGYESLLCCTGYNLDIRKNYINLILSKKIDGLILAGSNFIGSTREENQYIKDASAQIPIMILNGAFDHPNVYSTYCDDHAAMQEAASALLNAGIRDILYLYDSRSYSGIRKLKGFRAAMEEYGIADYEKRIFFYDKNAKTGPDTKDGNIDKFVKADKDPNADKECRQPGEIADFIESITQKGLTFHGIIASDDALAVGCMKYACRNGLRIPEDLSIIGYNNSMLAGCCIPELTSVDNRLESQTHQLVQTLLGVLSGNEMPKKTVFSGKLIKRGTTPVL